MIDIPTEGPPPGLRIQNSRDEPVVVRIRGTEAVYRVEANRSSSVGFEECFGDGVLIEDGDGTLLAEHDGEVCPYGFGIWLRSDDSIVVKDFEEERTPVGPTDSSS